MEASRKAKLTMYQVIKDDYNKNPILITLISIFLTVFKALMTHITDIAKLKDLSLGDAKNKNPSNQAFHQLMVEVSRIIYSFDFATSDNKFKKAIRFNFSKFLEARCGTFDTLLQSLRQEVYCQ